MWLPHTCIWIFKVICHVSLFLQRNLYDQKNFLFFFYHEQCHLNLSQNLFLRKNHTKYWSKALKMEKKKKKSSETENKREKADFLLLNFCSIGLPPFPMAFHIIMKGIRQSGCGIPNSFTMTGDNVTDARPVTFCFWVASSSVTISTSTRDPHSNRELWLTDRTFSNSNIH